MSVITPNYSDIYSDALRIVFLFLYWKNIVSLFAKDKLAEIKYRKVKNIKIALAINDNKISKAFPSKVTLSLCDSRNIILK